MKSMDQNDEIQDTSKPPSGAKEFAADFGARIRALRSAQGVSLRGFASKVEFSPAYLSKIERGEFSPPGEQKIIALALGLNQDPDELLGVAGRISSDLPAIIRRCPKQYAALLRAAQHLSSEQLIELQAHCRKLKESSDALETNSVDVSLDQVKLSGGEEV